MPVDAIIIMSFSIMPTVFISIILENSKYRPKFMGNSQKLWDSIADKTFCVDFSRTKDER